MTLPLLLGLDPGSGEGALPASSASGSRLASLAGLDGPGYEAAFDRINLHREPSPASLDATAAHGIAATLRGRRVLALGVRAMAAVSARPFEWRLSPGLDCVVAGMPHPSGLSRFWNDPENIARVGAFLRLARRPCIHVEGPDGSGKSTLVPRLADLMGLSTVPTEDPPKSGDECLRRVNVRLAPGAVSDRSSGLVSELVYGPVLRGSTLLGESAMWDLVASVAGAVTFVHCRPPRLAPTVRPGEDPVHVAACCARAGALRERYDQVMETMRRMGCTVVDYDYTRQSPEDLARELT